VLGILDILEVVDKLAPDFFRLLWRKRLWIGLRGLRRNTGGQCGWPIRRRPWDIRQRSLYLLKLLSVATNLGIERRNEREHLFQRRSKFRCSCDITLEVVGTLQFRLCDAREICTWDRLTASTRC